MKTNRKAGYLVNGRRFKTKAAVADAVRAILYAYDPGEMLSPDDLEFMSDLLTHHYDSAEKSGCGIAAMSVESNPIYRGNRGFWITRTDGSRIDFSFLECLKNSGPKDWFRSACRRLVLDQILDFKERAFAGCNELTCPLTGQSVTPASCHVDHTPPNTFDALVRRFCFDRGIDWNDPALTADAPDGITILLTDEVTAILWKCFHGLRAELRITSRLGNLSVAKRRASS